MHPVAAEGVRDSLPDEVNAAQQIVKTLRRRLGSVPVDAHGKLGCPKCVQSAMGCSVCRRRLGLKVRTDGSWSW